MHGHLEPSCELTLSNKTPLTLNFLNQSYEYLNRRTEEQVRELRRHPDVSHVEIVWECDIKRMDPPLKKHPRDINRLRPRDCLRGGRVRTYVRTQLNYPLIFYVLLFFRSKSDYSIGTRNPFRIGRSKVSTLIPCTRACVWTVNFPWAFPKFLYPNVLWQTCHFATEKLISKTEKYRGSFP